MRCPVCKKNIDDNSLKCPYCNSRTGMRCKECNTVNSLGDLRCKNCGAEILKKCPQCGSINFLTAENCRKCGTSLKGYSNPFIGAVSQKSAKNILVRGIHSDDKKIFSLSGDKGSGKSIVLKAVMQETKDYVWLYGKCTPITQLTPGGLIQDMLLNVFNLPNFCLNGLKFKKDAFKYFKSEFPDLTNDEIYDFINFLYPEKMGIFEEISSNKLKTFSFLEKILDKILSGAKFVITADNFEFTDGFSYEFLSRYIKKPEVFENLKLLLIYNEQRPSKGYFWDDGNIYLDVAISSLEFKQMSLIINQKKKRFEDFPDISKNFLREIFKISKGNPSYISHALDLYYDSRKCEQKYELCANFKTLLERRLALLSYINPKAYDILICSAIIGDKININLIREIFNLDTKQFKEIFLYLKKADYINPVNDLYFEFSSVLLWETIVKNAKNDKNYNEINEKVFNYLMGFTLNSVSVLAIIAQNLKQPKLALDVWSKLTRLAVYVGDMSLYAISQKQSLALINEFDEKQTLKIRYNIFERLGKLLANSNPKEAMEYLPDAISNAEGAKKIELLAYLASACRKTGSYFGEVECVDKVLGLMKPEKALDIALLKTTKLNALLSIGNCGQVVNMIDTEIMPVLDAYFTKKHPTSKTNFVFETWLKTYLVLANALVLQGDDRAYEILTILFDIIERNNIQDDNFICKCKLTLAFAGTMKGNFAESNQILEETLKSYPETDSENVIRWNFVNIMNNFFQKRYHGMQDDLFKTVTFASNVGDNFTKNVLKTLLGKIIKDSGNSKQAAEIYQDQIAYFAKEKMALGALLTWYLIADSALVSEGPQSAAEIAEQALQVAQNPKIDNHFFIVLFKMLIAKCYMTTSDFETAKINLEGAITLAKKFNMNDILSRLYILYGRYFQEIGLIKSERQIEYLQGAKELYGRAKELIEFTKNRDVFSDLNKSKDALTAYCKLNNIEL